MDPSDRLRSLKKELDIPVMGFADAGLWDTDPLVSANVPAERRPRAIMPEAVSAVVIGLPVQKTILCTAPSIYYRELYKTVNSLLDITAQRIVNSLDMLGFKAVFIPRDGYHGMKGLLDSPTSFFSHKHAAYLAGLGTFGVNNTILTPQYGPRIRFTTVLTDAPLPHSAPMKEELCIGCMRCAKECPAQAIGEDVYPRSKIDKMACTHNSDLLNKEGISPCGRCIAVCPIGKDKVGSPTEGALNNIRSYVIRS